jgi:hypothetical protein
MIDLNNNAENPDLLQRVLEYNQDKEQNEDLPVLGS